MLISTTRDRRRTKTLVLTVLLSLAATLLTALSPTSARAQDGDILRTITAATPSCSVGTGIAFDGTDLSLSCWYTSAIWTVDPADGSLVDTYTTTNVGQGFGALAFDRRRQTYWACTYPNQDVVQLTLDKINHSYTIKPGFHPAGGCLDGLAYDGTDDTLFVSGDVAPNIYHYTASGTQISARSIAGQIGACNSSGLAVGGPWLFMANNGCSQIYRSQKNTGGTPTLFGSLSERLEDMECDDVTFGASGKALIWSKDAYDQVLNAFELNPGDCGFGGQPAGSLDLTPGYQQAPRGSAVAMTISGGPLVSLGSYRAQVLSGPNAGLPFTFTCSLSCNGATAQATYRAAPGAAAGVDTIQVYFDANFNSRLDSEERSSYVFVKWNEPIHAVAMGDSYSAGEGVDPYDSGTDDDFGKNRNQCHRSAFAYSRQLYPAGYTSPVSEVAKAATGTTFDFIACSGARTYNVKRGGTVQFNEAATQVDRNKATSDTDLVTISIGGNDVGFSDLVKLCAQKDCNDPHTRQDGLQAKEWGAARLNELPAKLDTTIADIKNAAGNATVVLLGYPHLFPASAAEQGCSKLHPWAGEQDWFNDSAEQLNNTMSAAAARAGVHYVPLIDAFAGHEICGNSGEWLSGVTIPNLFDLFHKTIVGSGSFHPNKDGQTAGYAHTLNTFLLRASESLPTNDTGLPLNPTGYGFRRMAAASPAVQSLDAAAAAPSELGPLAVAPVAGDAQSACLPDGLVRAGASFRIAGEGYAPNAAVAIIWDTSTTTTPTTPIATLQADTGGRIEGTVSIPTSSAVEDTALLHATGAGTQGGPLELLAYLGVAKPCPVAGPTYTFSGFYSPVDNAPTVNSMQAGRAVPIKFSLGADKGLDVLAPGSPTSVKVTCSTHTAADEFEQTSTAGASALTYDPTTGRYQYVWKTEKTWAGTCRQFSLTLKDGSTHTALFSFRK